MSAPSQDFVRIRPVSGPVAVLALIAASVARNRASIQPPGNRWLWADVALLLLYASASVWVTFQQSTSLNAAVRMGSVAGMLLGCVLAANHMIELFVSIRNFALVIAPVLLALLLCGSAGSAARERTGSVAYAAVAGVWCAITGVLILLTIAFAMNLVFEERAELPLKEPFVASGLSDPGAFLVQNSLKVALEGLVRTPVFALFLSLIGATGNVVMTRTSRRTALPAACISLLALIAGIAALWHANSLERSARPPFVMSGVLLAASALCAAHPVWTSLQRRQK